MSAVKVTAVSVKPGVRRVVSRLPEVFPFQSHRAVAEAFAAEVERSLEGGVLRYSRRATLLRQARERGIGRFDANLIIATVQHRLTPRPVVAEAVIVQARDGQKHWWHVALTVAVAQSLIGFTVWWVLLR